ncbi:MAG: hypothetical protein ABI359_08425 [Ginsengibacter sp.]
MKISYLENSKIDRAKWDRCIDNADNGLIYPYSFYLDAMTDNWDGLILNDYEMVMPLTWKKKFTIYYLYQPYHTASLGVFGNIISKEIVHFFLNNIPSKFKYWDFYMNRDNLFSLPDFPMYVRSNYILPLNENYETLASKYASSHARNIKRARQSGDVVKKDIPIWEVIELAKEQSKKFSSIEQKHFDHFAGLYDYLKEQKQSITYGVYSSKNILLASCAYFFSHQRAFYILVGNHPNAKSSGASHLIIDQFIKDHAGENLILDFEGSNIPSIAFFYKSFGARLEKYPGIKLNRLSKIGKLFKQ